MEKANYRAPSQASQLNISRGDRDAALARGPHPSRRYRPQFSPSSHAALLAAVNPGQREMPRHAEGSGNRRRNQLQVDNVPRVLQVHRRRARGGRRQRYQQQHRRNQYLNRKDELGQQEREKDLVNQDPCSSNSCRGEGGQHRSSVHRPQCEQRRRTNWQGHNWRRYQRQRTEPTDQVQAGGQEEVMFWNVKEHHSVNTLHVPTALLQNPMRLRPMNVAGFCLPGMCTPHNTSQYIMEQHEDTWRNQEEAAMALSGGHGNYSTADEDFHFPSMTQEIDDTSTEEEEEESSQHAYQD